MGGHMYGQFVQTSAILNGLSSPRIMMSISLPALFPFCAHTVSHFGCTAPVDLSTGPTSVGVL